MAEEFEVKIDPWNTVKVPSNRILTNEITFPFEYNPHNVRLWVVGETVGNAGGPILGMAWASCASDALDELADAGLLDGLAVEKLWEEEEIEDAERERGEDCFARLGNDSGRYDLEGVWYQPIDLKWQSMRFIVALAKAQELYPDNLEGIE